MSNMPAMDELPPFREIRQEREFTATLQRIQDGEAGAAWAQKATMRAEEDRRRVQQIVLLMLPEMLRMQLVDEKREEMQVAAQGMAKQQ